MEAYREIIAGSKLAEVMDLPENLRKSELEVIILPVVKEKRYVKKKSPLTWKTYRNTTWERYYPP